MVRKEDRGSLITRASSCLVAGSRGARMRPAQADEGMPAMLGVAGQNQSVLAVWSLSARAKIAELPRVVRGAARQTWIPPNHFQPGQNSMCMGSNSDIRATKAVGRK